MSSLILIDSSAFIEYYRPSGSPAVQAAVAEAIGTERVAVNGIIQVEILAFAPDQANYRKLQADFQAFHWLNLGSEEFALATELGFQLRRQGITIPPADLIIAASGIQAGATLYHVDGHYDSIAQYSNLAVRHLSPKNSKQ
ncbi:MAG TPA: PIN domain-containing protein [Thermoanaerobaculia bacterium]|nr:PIN domain-containing protein [Thermoanaerobaculia bacterium]